MGGGLADLEPSATAEDLPDVDHEELKAAETVVATLDKTSRIYQLYPANNRIYIDFMEALTALGSQQSALEAALYAGSQVLQPSLLDFIA